MEARYTARIRGTGTSRGVSRRHGHDTPGGALGILRNRRAAPHAFVVTFWTIFGYSLAAHKEFRFLLPCVSASIVSAASTMSASTPSRSPRRRRLRRRHQRHRRRVHLGVAQAGTIAVMPYIARLARTADLTRSGGVLFATPCHQTPFYSHVHADVAMSFLDCSPDVPPGEDASARFAADPALYLSTTYDAAEARRARLFLSSSSSSTPTRAAPPTGSPLATTDSQNLSTTPTSRSTASSSVECSSTSARRRDVSVSMSPFLTVCPYTYPDTPDPPPNRPALVSARPSSSTRVAMRDARRRESRPSDERYVRALRKKLREATAKTIELAAAGTIEKSDDARDDDDDVERRLARWRSTVEDTLVKLRGAGFSNVDDERRRGEEDAKEVIWHASSDGARAETTRRGRTTVDRGEATTGEGDDGEERCVVVDAFDGEARG